MFGIKEKTWRKQEFQVFFSGKKRFLKLMLGITNNMKKRCKNGKNV